MFFSYTISKANNGKVEEKDSRCDKKWQTRIESKDDENRMSCSITNLLVESEVRAKTSTFIH